jgi:hypothetical protein
MLQDRPPLAARGVDQAVTEVTEIFVVGEDHLAVVASLDKVGGRRE